MRGLIPDKFAVARFARRDHGQPRCARPFYQLYQKPVLVAVRRRIDEALFRKFFAQDGSDRAIRLFADRNEVYAAIQGCKGDARARLGIARAVAQNVGMRRKNGVCVVRVDVLSRFQKGGGRLFVRRVGDLLFRQPCRKICVLRLFRIDIRHDAHPDPPYRKLLRHHCGAVLPRADDGAFRSFVHKFLPGFL